MSELLEKFTRNEFGGNSNIKHGGSKESASSNGGGQILRDSGSGKFTSSYTKNLNHNNNNNNQNNMIHNYNSNGQSSVNGNGGGGGGVAKILMMSSSNNNTNGGGVDIMTTLNNSHNQNNNNNIKVQNSYDRYPKRGGGLQVFPMNGLNEQMNTNNNTNNNNGGDSPLNHALEVQRQRAHVERLREQEVSRAEQDRLEEILQLCAEYERQNSSSSNMTASPIVQNRIKTNGSLPRDKKSPFGSEMSSPMFGSGGDNSHNNNKHAQIFFPSDGGTTQHNQEIGSGSGGSSKTPKKGIITTNTGSTGYENVALITSMRRLDVSNSRYENVSDVVGDTHEYPLTPAQKKYVPQSPRTKIRTNCQASPKPVQRSVEQERKTEYDLLMKSFEDRQVMEDSAKSGQYYSEAEKRIMQNVRLNGQNGQGSQNGTPKSVTPNTTGGDKADGKSLATLKRSRNEVLRRVRELKTQIADLQRQEDEVLREVSFICSLYSGSMVGMELCTEVYYLYNGSVM